LGGTGSGWQGVKKTTVEECLVLAIGDLADFGAFQPGWRKGSYSWRCGKEHVAELEVSTSMSTEDGTLWLRYTADEKFMHYTVSLVSTVLPYGGRRWWFICPIKKIRVAKLYLPPGATQFGSRKAHDLTYASCRAKAIRERSERFWRRVARRQGVHHRETQK